MIDLETCRKAWTLLSHRERRNGLIVLIVVIVTALAAALMVGSVLPFLSVLADPSSIRTISQLDWAYQTFEFRSDFSFLIALGLLTLSIIILSNALMIVRIYVITRYATMRAHNLSRKLLGLYLNQPYDFFLGRNTADMSTRVLSEADQAVSTFYRPFIDGMSAIITLAALVALLLLINPVVAVSVLLVFGGLYAGLVAIIRQRLSELGRRRSKSNKQRFQTAKEVLDGIKEVKLHGHEASYLARFDASSYRNVQSRMAARFIGALPQYLFQAFSFGAIIILCLALMDRSAFETGSSVLGDFLPLIGVIAFAGQRMMPELSRLYQSIVSMRFGAAAIDNLFSELKSAKPVSALPRRTHDFLGLTSELRLEDMSYSYPNVEKTSLRDVSLTITAGERIGIVGGTGAGKTTLADIILGLLQPSAGQILVDGVEIDETTRRRWQQSVGYVPQDIFLIDATVAENIAFGIPSKEIDRERIKEVARIAQLDGFVRRELPQGYDTMVGDRGVRLSGGQRQRIGIARALYQGADLIVFDEATSALDNLTERDVMAAIEAMPGNKTILMIAHRLTTVKRCDRIVILEHGEIAGIGSWAQLLEQSPSFRKLADAA